MSGTDDGRIHKQGLSLSTREQNSDLIDLCYSHQMIYYTSNYKF